MGTQINHPGEKRINVPAPCGVQDISGLIDAVREIKRQFTMTGPSKNEVTDDDLYRHSSQFRLWSFTKDEFHQRQLDTYARGKEKMERRLQEKGLLGKLEPLTFEQEVKIIKVYASKVEKITELFKMPSQVQGTAISYFRKFYLVYSVMDYHPMNILYTCVFLATKSENHFISIERFCAGLKRTEPATILGLEFLLLQSLSFTLAVQSGLRPLHGFFLDMQSALPDLSSSAIGSLHDRARKILIKGFITDALFLYTPPQVALAALHTADKDLTEKYLLARHQKPVADKLLAIIHDCQPELTNTDLPSSEEAKEIDKKLHYLVNPDKFAKRSHDGDGPQSKKAKTDPDGGHSGSHSAEPSVEPPDSVVPSGAVSVEPSAEPSAEPELRAPNADQPN
uniref:ARAD1C32648p n=1 Tax=Blastobotrys adeninivorans TaxID=409370 RepID=A0A060T8V4_BLAAD